METEIKLEVPDLAVIRERLRGLGAVYLSTVDETNLYFDRPDGAQGAELRARGESLRLRQDVRVRLTWKGPTVYRNGVIERPEVEVVVDDFAAMAELLGHLGYQVVDRLAKRRETWRLPAAEVALDQLSFGSFVEVEGPGEGAVRIVEALGLDPRQGISVSYRILQQQRRSSA